MYYLDFEVVVGIKWVGMVVFLVRERECVLCLYKSMYLNV